MVDTMDVEMVGEAPTGRGKVESRHPLGRPAVDTKAIATFKVKPLNSKRDYLRDQWLELMYLTLSKANSFALTVSKKDFGRLMQIATVAGIGWDKVFPKDIASVQLNLVQNLFNGLPQGKVIDVIGGTPQASSEVAQTAIDTYPPQGDSSPQV